jgi:hypothetical protein
MNLYLLKIAILFLEQYNMFDSWCNIPRTSEWCSVVEIEIKVVQR